MTLPLSFLCGAAKGKRLLLVVLVSPVMAYVLYLPPPMRRTVFKYRGLVFLTPVVYVFSFIVITALEKGELYLSDEQIVILRRVTVRPFVLGHLVLPKLQVRKCVPSLALFSLFRLSPAAVVWHFLW